MNKININEQLVAIDTEIPYKAIELLYYGELYIDNVMPNDYIVQKGNGRIIIIRFNTNEDIVTDLFKYDGSCSIYEGYLLDQDKTKHQLNIKKKSLVNFNTMHGQKWEYLTNNFNDIKNNLSNDKVDTLNIRNETDTNTGKNTQVKEIVKKAKQVSKKDKNLTTIESFTEQIKIKSDDGSDETRYGDLIGNLRHYRK